MLKPKDLPNPAVLEGGIENITPILHEQPLGQPPVPKQIKCHILRLSLTYSSHLALGQNIVFSAPHRIIFAMAENDVEVVIIFSPHCIIGCISFFLSQLTTSDGKWWIFLTQPS